MEEPSLRVRIEGINRAVRALDAAGADMGDMKDLMHKMGMIVVHRARTITPVLTGTLRNDIRAGRGKTKAVVRAGRKAISYAPVIHYGWPKRNIHPSMYLTTALQQTQSQVIAEFERGLSKLLKKNGL